jgi:hypothetical protein
MIISVLLTSIVIRADDRLRVPEDTEPPVYTSAAGPAFQSDGSLFVVHDSQWAAIPFWRSPDCVRPDFNLLEQVDVPAAFGCELLVRGFLRRQRNTEILMSWQAWAVDEVPIWFVSWSELQTAMADNVLTITELEALPSLVIGNSSNYEEQNHTFFGHNVSHLSLRATGTLEDGRAFQLGATEVALGLIQVNIRFR